MMTTICESIKNTLAGKQYYFRSKHVNTIYK